MECPEEIARITKALRTHNALAIDSSRYRRGVTRDLVEVKLAELIVNAFRLFQWMGDGRTEASRLIEAAGTARDGYKRAAWHLRRVDRNVSNLLALRAAYFNDVMMNLKGLDNRGAQRSEHLDDLILDLWAALNHTTDLTKDHALKEVVTRILDVAWTCYPDCAPKRGRENPLARFKRFRRRFDTSSGSLETFISGRRHHVFDCDNRFPQDLFQPHRTTRTVPPADTKRYKPHS